MSISVEYFEKAVPAMSAAKSLLSSKPVEHNLVATFLEKRLDSAESARYWLARDNKGQACGFGCNSSLTGMVLLSVMKNDVVDAIAQNIHARGVGLSGALGDAATVSRFAGMWTELTDIGAQPELGMRIYEQKNLGWTSSSTGRLRSAEPSERDLMIEWTTKLREEIGETAGNAEKIVDLRISDKSLFVWDDGGPKTVVAHSKFINGVTRILMVYTPKEYRNQGFAYHAVATLSDRLNAQNVRRILYTDLGNPTPNKLYRKIGYRSVSEVLNYKFS